jgi:hypothetical protein
MQPVCSAIVSFRVLVRMYFDDFEEVVILTSEITERTFKIK